jgi:hypothetical protein
MVAKIPKNTAVARFTVKTLPFTEVSLKKDNDLK